MEILQGTNQPIPLQFKNNGVPVDISGLTIRFTAKKLDDTKTDDTGAIVVNITTHSEPTQGKTTLDIPIEKTAVVGDYLYEYARKKDNIVYKTIPTLMKIKKSVSLSPLQ